MTSAPIVLVPGFWLGAWAWHEVAETLRADGHHVTALTHWPMWSRPRELATTIGDVASAHGMSDAAARS